jgi:hypothetical protein
MGSIPCDRSPVSFSPFRENLFCSFEEKACENIRKQIRFTEIPNFFFENDYFSQCVHVLRRFQNNLDV